MLSFALFAADADIYYYNDASKDLFCSLCGTYIGSSLYCPDLKIKKLKNDFSHSYDGQLILSETARNFLEDNATTELKFHEVNTFPAVFVVEVTNRVLFDSEKRKTRFINRCEQCGGFESVVGASPPFLKKGSDIEPMGIYLTDILFGSGKEKSPLFIVGEKLGRRLKHRFKEIDLEEVKI